MLSSTRGYRGRFAPSPTGSLHFGSLVAAIGSYLDAKHHHGTWLVRIEDLDTPRCTPEAADDILRTLEAFGLHSDETVLYQSQRTSAYEEALLRLKSINATYPCCCTRKEIADSALHGIEGLIYPGNCREGIPTGREGRSWRVKTDYFYRHSRLRGRTSDLPAHGLSRMASSSINDEAQGIATVTFNDALQGRITQNLETEIGDFVVKRADGLFAYQLAVVVDDAFQSITHIVRGADLLASISRQIYLQRLLGLATPDYGHLPVAVNNAGEKLSKQTQAAPVNRAQTNATMLLVLNFLQQQPPAELADYDVRTILDWAIQHWDAAKLQGVKAATTTTLTRWERE